MIVCHGYPKAEREILMYQPVHPLSLGMGGNCTVKNLLGDWFHTSHKSGAILSFCVEILRHICDSVSSSWTLLLLIVC